MKFPSKHYLPPSIVAFIGILVTLAASFAAVVLLYRVQIEGAKTRLSEALNTQVRIVESIARSNASNKSNGGGEQVMIDRIVEAYRNNRGIGKSSEFVLGRLEGDNIIFLLEQRNAATLVPIPIPLDEALSGDAQPMGLALSGRRGTIIAKDYRGVEVIAAYTEIPSLGLGIVAKIDKSEIVYPFYKATAGVFLVVVTIVIVGLLVMYQVTGRLLNQLDASEKEKTAHLDRIEDQRRALDIHAIVSITDAKGKINYANDHFCKLSGYSREEIFGKTHSLVKSGYHNQDFYNGIWAKILLGQTWKGEIRNLSKSGDFYWLDTTIVPFRGADGVNNQYIAIQSDITKRKEYEMDLIAAREEAEKANNAKSMFLANMSHEIRTPMNSILGYSELLLHEQLDAVSKQYLSSIRKSGAFLLDIINGILDVSRIEAGEESVYFDDVDVEEAVLEVCEMLASMAREKGIYLKWDFQQDSKRLIRTDGGLFKQMLTNVVSNGIKFTHEGGVSVRVGLNSDEDDTQTLLIRVADTGIGIPSDKLESVFDKFMQVDPSMTRRYGGTGLGLSIARGLARMLGGDISVRSKLGSGSEFFIELPFREAKIKLPYAKEGQSESTNISQFKGNVLVVEDDETNREIIRKMLRSLGVKCDVVEDGASAVERILKKRYQVILMDCQMPGMDGFETTERIRLEEEKRGLDHVRIVAVTARAMKGDREQCLDAQMDDYIAKPISRDSLSEALCRKS